MIILGIDPAPYESGVVLWNSTASKLICSAAKYKNENLIDKPLDEIFYPHRVNLIAIERIRGYGMLAGNEVFDTCETVGRFFQHFKSSGYDVRLIARHDVKMHLCGTKQTNDKFIRQALIDKFGEQGTKKAQGPLYGVASHAWAALAVAITAAETLLELKA